MQKIRIDIAIYILFYERLDQTIECISSFLPSGVKIKILNNGSSNSSREALGSYCENYEQITIFDSDSNLGVAAGRNYLISHTTEEWLLFVDNDITIRTKDWLKRIIYHIANHKDIEVFIPKLFNLHEYSYAEYDSFRIVNDRVLREKIVNGYTNAFPGGASFVNRKLFDRLGTYDDKMFVGFQDFELSIRAIHSDHPIKAKLINDIELFHDHQPIIKAEDKKAILTRYNYKRINHSHNRIAKKYNLILLSNWKTWASQQIERSFSRRNQIMDLIFRRFLFLIYNKHRYSKFLITLVNTIWWKLHPHELSLIHTE